MHDQTVKRKRRVFWVLLALIALVILGSATGIFLFKNVLRPGQQQRVINILPFMEIFLWHPPEDYALPTPLPSTSGISPEDLLSITLERPTLQATEEVAGEAQETTIPERTPVATLIP
jgi:hypothetical protein